MDFTEIFGKSGFKTVIKGLCNQVGYKIAEIDENMAKLIFETDGVFDQTLYIISYGKTLEFSVPSSMTFDEDDADDDIIKSLSLYLLKRNSSRKVGFWAIEQADNSYVFSIMHNSEMTLINPEYFAFIIQSLVSECDEFDNSLKRFSR